MEQLLSRVQAAPRRLHTPVYSQGSNHRSSHHPLARIRLSDQRMLLGL